MLIGETLGKKHNILRMTLGPFNYSNKRCVSFAEFFFTSYINVFSEKSHLLDNCLPIVYFALYSSNKMYLLCEYQRFVIACSQFVIVDKWSRFKMGSKFRVARLTGQFYNTPL